MKNRLAYLSAVVLALVQLGSSENPPANLATTAQASLATVRGTLKIAGLSKPVRVLRDRWGVAHIYAENQHDLFFAQGFVAAQDRLFQMELWKRSGQGRLADVLGPSAVQRDTYARLLRYRGDMKAEYESYSPDTKQILEAFTSGINAFIAAAGGSTGSTHSSSLPIEFQLAGFRPEPWKPEDCLNRMAAFSMTGNSFSELQHAEAVATVGADKASPLFEFDPPVKLDPAQGLDLAGLTPALLQGLVGSDVRIEFPARAAEGSNNWTVSGALTNSGKPLLANDPHRVIAEPSLRYIVHLVAPGWDVIGAGEPALPGVALGHNQNIAWGFTIFGLDQQDLYVEELNPTDPLQYKTESGWQRMQVEKEVIAVRGGNDVTVDLKFTRHGPVLWSDGKRALALRWVGAEPGTAGYLGSLAVDRAQNWNDFELAMSRWKVPSENIVYADRQGNIGEHSTGLEPLRKNWTGLLPVPGNGAYEWAGFLVTSELPHFFNPKQGFIATANHRMIEDDYEYNIGFEWAPRFRIERIKEVLGEARDAKKKLSLEDMERLQTDTLSRPALELIALLRKTTDNSDAFSQMMLHWDGVLGTDSAAAALYEFWQRGLAAEVMKRAAPEKLWPTLDEWTPSQVLKELQHPRTELFGENATQERDLILHQTLAGAAAKLRKLRGDDAAQWSWGEIHQVRFRHPLDQVAGASALVDPRPLARPGDEYTVNATGYEGESYDQVSGASYREILDTSDWDKSVAVNTPGQSGQPGSPHYSDLLPLWQKGEYFPLPYSVEAVSRATSDTLVLKP